MQTILTAIITSHQSQEFKKAKMAATAMSSTLNLKPSSFDFQKPAAKGLPSLTRTSFTVKASGIKKIKTDKPFGIGGGMELRDGKDASGRKPTGKGVYQFVDKYGANVDGYSPIYNEEEWSPSGDVYVGGTTGLLIWAVTLAGILGGGALLVYSTSALAQ
ncbi:hypothetical protein L1887_25671 [Cichorium endivia]|nr:hypothetical protein L1887_25671 [Cichorium endivia]